jgi:uncharacterized RDD family membrane protein YckC
MADKDDFTKRVENWFKKLDEVANRPRRRMLEKRAEEKASIYASFNARSLAGIIDLSLVLLLLMPILIHVSRLFYGSATNPMFGDVRGLSVGELWDLLIQSQYLYSLMLDYLANFIILGMVFVGFWQKFSCTPGKWLLRMRIVDDATLQKPTFKQFLIRYVTYSISATPLTLGFMWVMWSKKRQGWHDLFAKTVVVKVDDWKLRN